MSAAVIPASPAGRAVFRPDLAQARAYLSALAGEDDPVVTFQTFTDTSPKPDPDPLAAWRHGTLAQHAAWLTRMNDRGAGIFTMVNAGDGRGRSAENVVRIRAVFLDKDKPLVRPCALRPTFVVLTTPDASKAHAYWRIRGELPLDRFKPTQKRVIAFYGSDPGVHDLPRVMRLPGFYHRKKEPVLVTFEMDSGEAYTEEEILAAHPSVLVPRAAGGARAPRPTGRSSSADDEEVLRDLVHDVADRRSWAIGDRHDSAIDVAAYMRKLGMSDDEIRAVVECRLVESGKAKEEADKVIEWSAQVAEKPGDRARVVEIERRRREREERQRKATR